MATLNAPTLDRVAYSGEAPLAVEHGKMLLASAQINDKVRLSRLFAGSKVHEAKLVNGALGASVTIDLGFEYTDGQSGSNTTQWLVAQACTSAGASRSATAPVTLEHDAYIVATVKGAAASGQIDSVITFEFKGK